MAAWDEDEIKLLGTKPDREVAQIVGRSISAVQTKRLLLLWIGGSWTIRPWHGAIWVHGGWYRHRGGWGWRGGHWR